MDYGLVGLIRSSSHICRWCSPLLVVLLKQTLTNNVSGGDVIYLLLAFPSHPQTQVQGWWLTSKKVKNVPFVFFGFFPKGLKRPLDTYNFIDGWFPNHLTKSQELVTMGGGLQAWPIGIRQSLIVCKFGVQGFKSKKHLVKLHATHHPLTPCKECKIDLPSKIWQ